jgi:hypothetical protein
MALSGGLCIPLAFRPPAFASRSFLFPLENWPPSRSAYCQIGRPHRGFHVPHEGDAVGVGASYTPGTSVFVPRLVETSDRLRPNIIVSAEIR